MARLRVSIIGASGYTGIELVRILLRHPEVELVGLAANRNAGKPLSDLFPQVSHEDLPGLETAEVVLEREADLIFNALPHGASQPLVKAVMAREDGPKLIDLSADFRLKDAATYEDWYATPHEAQDLLPRAAYGLPELNRENVRGARLVANPGCYPTTAQLALVPLIRANLLSPDAGIIIDAKSGVTGAGRAAKEHLLLAEAGESFSAYGIAGHRHMPEIAQGLELFGGRAMDFSFTPHLLPISRGILETIYLSQVELNAEEVKACWREAYEGEPFVQVVEAAPATAHVRGTNLCRLAAFDAKPSRRGGASPLILVGVIDNLVKGAAGQAVQNMNLMFGLPETLGLEAVALAP